MLSTIDTALALTILDQKGTKIRVARDHPAYAEVKALLPRADLTSEEILRAAQNLLLDRLAAVVSWASRFNVTLKRDADKLVLNGTRVDAEQWEPMLARLMRTGGSPGMAVTLAREIGEATHDLSKVCMHWTKKDGSVATDKIAFTVLRPLPESAQAGDSVANTFTTEGPLWGLVKCGRPTPEGTLPSPGEVLVVDRFDVLQDIVAQPAILGFNRTYRCEEAAPSGWFEDLSSDSLCEALINLKEIRDSGSEARLVNRITGAIVNC